MKSKPIVQRLIVLFIGLLASAVLGEGILRIWTPGSLQYKAVRRADDLFHHSLVPSSQYQHRNRDFTVEVKTNSQGFRDRDHSNDRTGSFKILVLGDSFVEGYGVPMESCFVRRLEGRLNVSSQGQQSVAVYNYGVAGYSPIIEYLVLKHKGLALRPDMVILCYDMSDVQEDFLYSQDAEFDSAGTPIRVNPSWPSFGHVTLMPRSVWKTQLREKSYLYTFLADAISLAKPKPLYEEGNILAGTFMHTVDSTSERWEKFFRQSQTYVKLIADLCESNNIQFVLLTYPRGNQVNSSEWAMGRAYWGIDNLVHNSAIFPSLESFAARNNIPFLNMTAVFRARSDGHLYLPFDGHWTSKGHIVAADTLFSFLNLNHLIPN